MRGGWYGRGRHARGEDGDEDESVSSGVRRWTGDEDEGRQSRLGMYKQKKARVD